MVKILLNKKFYYLLLSFLLFYLLTNKILLNIILSDLVILQIIIIVSIVTTLSFWVALRWNDHTSEIKILELNEFQKFNIKFYLILSTNIILLLTSFNLKNNIMLDTINYFSVTLLLLLAVAIIYNIKFDIEVIKIFKKENQEKLLI